MSFILDALTRSDQERRGNSVPDLRAVHVPVAPAPPTRSVKFYVLIGALLLNAGLLFVWIQFRPASPALSGPTQRSVDAMPEESMVTPRAQARLDRNPEPPVVAMAAAEQQPPDAGSEPDVFTAAQTPAEVPETLPPPGVPSDWLYVTPQTLTQGAKAGTTGFDQREAPAPATRREILRLNELPPATRDALPPVVFSGHFYSSEPASRLVFVDGGRAVSEGQAVTSDLYVEEIKLDGVVLAFQGYRFRLGVLQNWSLK
jgi:hypothetical protein